MSSAGYRARWSAWATRQVQRDLACAPGGAAISRRSPEVVDAEIVEDEPDSRRPRPPPRIDGIVGIDGKTYPRPAPAASPPRRPITDEFAGAIHELTKAIERVSDSAPMTGSAAIGQVAAKHRSDLDRVADALSRVLNRFNN